MFCPLGSGMFFVGNIVFVYFKYHSRTVVFSLVCFNNVDFVDFYKLFVELEVSTIPELASSVKQFEKYLLANMGSIRGGDLVSQFRLEKTIEKSISILSRKTAEILNPQQNIYVDIVSKLSGDTASAKILV